MKEELIVLPVYNRAEILPNQLDMLFSSGEKIAEVLIVDDGSDDNLGDTITTNDRVKYLHHEKPLGYGGCVMSALHYAQAHDFEYMLLLDISYDHADAPIPLLRSGLISGNDLVSCSRVNVKADENDEEYASYDTSKMVTEKLNSVTGYDLLDPFSPFKGISVAALEKMVLEEFDEALILQLFIQSAHFKKSVSEIYCPEISEEHVSDASILERDIDHYLHFIQGEALLYPVE